MRNASNIRIGEIYKLKCGANAKIINYNSAIDLDVLIIESNEIINTNFGSLKKGSVKPRFIPTVYGVGYLGNYDKRDVNLKRQYSVWNHMMSRCYSDKFQNTSKGLSYKGCSVCKEWLNFENFQKWYNENYYEINGEFTQLDKDILVKNNKIYSPNTCIFTPKEINKLFVTRRNYRGNYVIGVHRDDVNNRFYAYINYNGKRSHSYLGSYKTEEDAFKSYKSAKEKYIKEVADKYKDKIPKRLYDAMYRWEVEIND